MPNKLAVIGGGPIGLFLALKLAMKGYQVCLFEKGSWPRDKVCGQGIMPSGFTLLKELGLSFENRDDHFRFNGIEYIDGDQSLKGSFQGEALGIERTVLSEKLFKRAQTCSNLQLIPSTEVIDLIESENKTELHFATDRNSEKFDFVFACDGLHSPIRKILNMNKSRMGMPRMGARVHFDIAPWSDKVQVYWQEGTEAYVTPVNAHRVEVAFLWYEEEVAKGADLKVRLLDRFPVLKKILETATADNDFKAYGPFREVSKGIRKGNVFFVGDAYQFIDGITGEGLSLGMKSAGLFTDNFEKLQLKTTIRIKLLYFNYAIWVNFALLMSRRLFVRRALFKFLIIFPNLFSIILKLNDFSLKRGFKPNRQGQSTS